MKILIYGINFKPELTGIGKYTGEMAFWLAEHGHEIRVVTAPPYYPDWNIHSDHKNWWYRQVMIISRGLGNSVRVDHSCAGLVDFVIYRCPLWVPKRPSGVKRLFHLASFALSSLPVMLRQIFWRPDVVWVVEPALFCAPTAVVVARLIRAKAWLHVQDFEVDAAFNLGLLEGRLFRSFVSSAERWLMQRFDIISTISKRMHQRLFDKGVSPSKSRLAINWVNIKDFNLSSTAGVIRYRSELNVPNESILALYSGNMGNKQGLGILADVASICRDVVFVFCGNGDGRDSLMSKCDGLVNVRFISLQPASCLPDLLGAADIHLLPQRADAADLVMPSKLTGMLASARPVVATAHEGTELADVVQSCGLVVPPEDPQAMAEAIMRLAQDRDLREQLGASGRKYANANLDKDVVLDKFEADLLAIVGEPF